MVCFRELFLLPLIGVVVTYNFTDCDLKEIVDHYEHIIYVSLNNCIKGREFNLNESCDTSPDCLGKIELHTFSKCQAQFAVFAQQTRSTFENHCKNFSSSQINNSQEIGSKEDSNYCLSWAFQIKGWWQLFIQFAPN